MSTVEETVVETFLPEVSVTGKSVNFKLKWIVRLTVLLLTFTTLGFTSKELERYVTKTYFHSEPLRVLDINGTMNINRTTHDGNDVSFKFG